MGMTWLADANPCPVLIICNDLLASCQHKHLPREAKTQPQEWILLHYFLLFSHPVSEWDPPFLPGVFKGQTPPRQDFCFCDVAVRKV